MVSYSHCNFNTFNFTKLHTIHKITHNSQITHTNHKSVHTIPKSVLQIC